MAKMYDCCRIIPAGISKRTGERYDSFVVCDNPGCPNYKPSKSKQGYQPKKPSTPAQATPNSNHTEVMGALRKIYEKIDKIEKFFISKEESAGKRVVPTDEGREIDADELPI
jgi:hypothetical protein